MENKYDLAAFDKVLTTIKDIQDQGNFLPEVSTKEGYEASKRFVLDVTTPARRSLEKAHKETKAPFLETCRFLDGKKKELMPLLEAIEAPHKEAYKAVDAEKKAKKERFEAELQEKIQVLINYRHQAIGKSSEEISDLIQACGETDTDEGFYHRGGDAVKARAESLELLNEELMKAVQREAEEKQAAELAEKQRLEQIEIKKKQDEIEEQQRVQELKAKAQERLNNLSMIPVNFIGKSSTEIKAKLNSLENYQVLESEFGELYEQACVSSKQVITQLTAMLNQQLLVEESQRQQEPKAEDKPEVNEPTCSGNHHKDENLCDAPKCEVEQESEVMVEVGTNNEVKPDLLDELSVWANKHGVSLDATSELNELLNKYNVNLEATL